MLNIKNNHLSVSLLDPVLDKALLGSRYCVGGYIYQVKDVIKGDLLSGPSFLSGTYNSFDGQGAPEVFVATINGDFAKVGDNVLVFGVGNVKKSSSKIPFHSRDNPFVTEFAAWDIQATADALVARTRQESDQCDISITRRVALRGRTVSSDTSFANNGEQSILLRWFPHPFFPIPPTPKACCFDFPVLVPDNPGYSSTENGTIEVKPDFDWNKGLYQPLTLPGAALFSARVKHPLVNDVAVSCNYAPSFLPLWANRETFSFEPYFEKIVGKGEIVSWKIEYDFGP